jgi:hypothetical protein
MYYTGLDPRTMKPVYSAKTAREKALQRAMLQWFLPQNRKLVLEALIKTGRQDLIGYGKGCLIRPLRAEKAKASKFSSQAGKRKTTKNKANKKPRRK